MRQSELKAEWCDIPACSAIWHAEQYLDPATAISLNAGTMDSLAVEDDICILRHETADSLLQPSKESPVSASSGDESVASHFALVTAYEDIKKRLKEAEKENALLKKRVKQLEEKLFKPHELTSEGSKYVNQAYNAYVGVYMEKTDLQRELDKVKREKTESETLLNEQLQAKELELLQLRTDVETSQVMKTMNSTQDYWDVYKVNSELKIHTLQQELELLHLEYNRLQEKYKDHHCSNVSKTDWNSDTELNSGDASLLKTYVDLRREMSNLYAVTKSQAKMVRKLRDNSQSAVSREPASVPVQCFEDVENNHRLVRVAAPGSPLAGSGPGATPAQGPTGELWPDPWTSPRPPPVGSPALQPHGSYGKSSLDDGSWSFPSSPKPSDALFWEAARSASSSDAPKSPGHNWLRPY